MPQHGGPSIKGHVALFEGYGVHYVYLSLLDKWVHRLLDLGTKSPHPFPASQSQEAWSKEMMMLRLSPWGDLDQFQKKAY